MENRRVESSDAVWVTQDRFLEMRSPWFTLIGEHLLDTQGQRLDYWRVERAHSVVVLPIYQDRMIVPPPMYRPGVADVTLDFPGGRLPPDQTPEQAAIAILERELGLSSTAVHHLEVLNSQGYAVNSSFSNQRLFGVVATLDPALSLADLAIGATFSTSAVGLHQLLQVVTCLQCRAIALEWWLQTSCPSYPT